MNLKRKIIGIHPSAGKLEKLWENKKFAELCDIFIENNYSQILLFGSKGDKNRIKAIIHNMKYKPIDCSHFNIEEFIYAVKECSIFICLDSFAQHVAFINKIPTVVIYNIKNDVRWTPTDSENKFLTVFNYNNEITANDIFNKIKNKILT